MVISGAGEGCEGMRVPAWERESVWEFAMMRWKVMRLRADGAPDASEVEWTFAKTMVEFSHIPVGDHCPESQRDSGLQPRVARHEPPWVQRVDDHNPVGVENFSFGHDPG